MFQTHRASSNATNKFCQRQPYGVNRHNNQTASRPQKKHRNGGCEYSSCFQRRLPNPAVHSAGATRNAAAMTKSLSKAPPLKKIRRCHISTQTSLSQAPAKAGASHIFARNGTLEDPIPPFAHPNPIPQVPAQRKVPQKKSRSSPLPQPSFLPKQNTGKTSCNFFFYVFHEREQNQTGGEGEPMGPRR